MKMLLIAASAAALSLAAPAMAQAQQVYGTIGYANVDIDPVNLGVIQGRLGIQFNANIGIEAEAGFGVADDEILGTTVELSNTYGAFVVARLPVSEQVDVFVRGGFARAEVDVGGTSASDDGGAYGIGGQLNFSPNSGVRLDYTRYSFGGDADVWSLAYVHKF